MTTDKLTPELLARIKELAGKATKGEWGVEDPLDHCLTVVANPKDPVYEWKWVATCDWPDEDDHAMTAREVKANAAYIAALNPTTILALVEAYERGVGEGWVLVPKEPTEAMIEAACKFKQNWACPTEEAGAYSAMIAVSPSPGDNQHLPHNEGSR